MGNPINYSGGISFGQYDENGGSCVLQPDGKILFVGLSYKIIGSTLWINRLNSDLSADSSFNDDGYAGNENYIFGGYGVAVQPDGKILTMAFNLARLNSDGSIDSSFGINGVVNMIGLNNGPFLQPDGKILAAGNKNETYHPFIITRFNNNTFSCSSDFDLVADTITPHHYWALNNAGGILPLKYFWEWGDGSSDTIAYPSHNYSTGGFYNICLTVTDSSSCTTQYCSYSQIQKLEKTNDIVYVDVVANIPTAIQNSNSESVSVSPNPASDNINFHFKNINGKESSLSIFDARGILMQNFSSIQSGRLIIPVTNRWSNGLYYFTIKVSNEKVIGGKFLIEK
jgi:uncharacterized delta-60 repeat protein